MADLVELRLADMPEPLEAAAVEPVLSRSGSCRFRKRWAKACPRGLEEVEVAAALSPADAGRCAPDEFVEEVGGLLDREGDMNAERLEVLPVRDGESDVAVDVGT